MTFEIERANAWSAFSAFFSAFLSLLLFGCGSSSNNFPQQPPKNPQPSSEFLYSTNVDGIMVFPVNSSTGALDTGTVAASGVTSLGFLANMVSDPAGKFLFVCSSGNSSIEAFSIDPGKGGLTPV